MTPRIQMADDAPVMTMRGREEEFEAKATPEEKLTKNERKKIVETARARFDAAQSAESNQRQRELDDLRFYGGDQWPGDVRTARAGQNAQNGMPPVPARPCITINETLAPVQNVLNQERNSDLGIELVPADDFGDDADTPENHLEIELREGLVRRIQRNSHAKEARRWAFERAVEAGRGYYRINVRKLPGKTMDREIYVDKIYNQAAVTIDPSHELSSGADAKWGFIGTWIPWADYVKEYGDTPNGRKNPTTDADDGEFKSLGETYPQWFKTDDNKHRAVHVVEYYYVEDNPRDVVELSDGSVYWADELPEVLPPGLKENSRETESNPTVKWCKLDGLNVLEDPIDWLGPDLPIIQVLGRELQPYDQEKRFEGMVRPMREPNQGENYMVSKMVEMIGLTPIPPLHVAEGQIEGYEKWYEAAATRVLPYLPYRTRDLEGNPVGAPSAVNRETPIQAVAASLSMFMDKIHTTSNVHDPSVGEVDPALRSAKAISTIIGADQHGTSNFIDNLVTSMEYEAQIENNLLYPVYGRKPGRIARLMNPSGINQTVMINKPADTTGLSQRAQQAKSYPLTKDAKLNVAVKISKDYDTRRQQEAALVGEILSADPQSRSIIGDIFFRNLDGPGHDEMAERFKLMLDPRILQYLADKKDGKQQLPPQAQQQLQQGQQVIQGLTEALKAAEMEKQGKVIENQGKLQIEQVKQDAENIRNRENNEVKLAVAELGAKVDRLSLFMEESQLVGARQHEQAQADKDRAHEVAMGAVGHEQALEQGDAAHQQGLEAQQQQAALEPPPAEATE